MDELKWEISTGKLLNMHSDLLVDILSWQNLIIVRLAALEAEERGVDPGVVEAEWINRKKEVRSHFQTEIFGKYGPDVAKDLGL